MAWKRPFHRSDDEPAWREPDPEPAGWRDAAGRSPVEALDAYREARFRLDVEVNRWGERDVSDEDIDAAHRAFRAVRERFLSPRGLAKAGIVGWAWPSSYDRAWWQVLGTDQARGGVVQVRVQSRHGEPEEWQRYRFDMLLVDGEWRLDKVTSYMPDNGRPFSPEW